VLDTLRFEVVICKLLLADLVVSKVKLEEEAVVGRVESWGIVCGCGLGT
jgi:hypothetical protein